MSKKRIHLLALLLSLTLLLPLFPTVYAAETQTETTEGENADNDVPTVIDVGDNCSTILVPVSGNAVGGQDRTYAVAISKAGELDTTKTKDTIANVWQGVDGTTTWTYIVGISEGETEFTLGNKTYTLRVVPRNVNNNGTVSFNFKSGNFDTSKVKMYYSVNGSTLYEFQPNEVLLNQAYPGYVNFMFFAAPQSNGNENCALTSIYAEGGAQQYYSLAGEKADGTDSDAWPYLNGLIPSDSNPVDSTNYPFKRDPFNDGYQHELANILERGHLTVSKMQDLYTRAKALGCDGVCTFNRQGSGSISNITITATAEKLPTMVKSITGYKLSTDADTAEWRTYTESDNPELRMGAKLQYTFTINRTITQNVEYEDVLLTDSQIGYKILLKYDIDSHSLKGYVGGVEKDKADYEWESSQRQLVITTEYTIKNTDANMYSGGSFTNSATLSYHYNSIYSSGFHSMSQSSEITCQILGIATYQWAAGLPSEITSLIVPESHEFVANEVATVSTNTYGPVVLQIDGTWYKYTFKGWNLTQDGDDTKFYAPGDTVTITENNAVNATLVGHWECEEATPHSVTYQWSGLPGDIAGESNHLALPTDNDTYYETYQFPVDDYYEQGSTYAHGDDVYVFSGWMLNGEVVSGDQIMGDQNVTLTGYWINQNDLTDLIIKVSGCNTDLDEDQTFLFHVTGEGIDVTVTVRANGTTTISGLEVGKTYTVTQITDWSWRYTPESETKTIELTTGDDIAEFKQTRKATKWLDGNTFWNILKKKEEGE